MTTNAWDAKLYDSKHSFVWEKAQGVMEQLAPQSGEHILDLGCGTGHLSAEIAANGTEMTGIDRSPEMIAQARKQHPSLRFEVCDAREMPFEGKFDAVFSNAVLHWILEPEKVVRGVAKALKPDGRFVAEFGGRGNIRRLVEAIARAGAALELEHRPASEVWYYPSVGEYAALLEKHSLEVREAALFERPTRLEDGEKGLEAWLRMFAGFVLERIPRERQDAFLREVESQARAELFKNGAWELDYRRLRILARKSA
jgi:trans-aconitate methyltransferase